MSITRFFLCFTGATFSKLNYESHKSIQKFSKDVDLEHSCGYITMLNTGRSSRTIFREDEFDDFLIDDEDFKEDNCDSDNPSNGIKDETCAQTLASELDMLEFGLLGGSPSQNSVQKLKDNMTLDLDSDEVKGQGRRKSSLDNTCESDWVLLECYFGIPLFSAVLNQEICQKIISQDLFSEKRYSFCLCLTLSAPQATIVDSRSERHRRL